MEADKSQINPKWVKIKVKGNTRNWKGNINLRTKYEPQSKKTQKIPQKHDLEKKVTWRKYLLT
jgi:hypothetical protein